MKTKKKTKSLQIKVFKKKNLRLNLVLIVFGPSRTFESLKWV